MTDWLVALIRELGVRDASVLFGVLCLAYAGREALAMMRENSVAVRDERRAHDDFLRAAASQMSQVSQALEKVNMRLDQGFEMNAAEHRMALESLSGLDRKAEQMSRDILRCSRRRGEE